MTLEVGAIAASTRVKLPRVTGVEPKFCSIVVHVAAPPEALRVVPAIDKLVPRIISSGSPAPAALPRPNRREGHPNTLFLFVVCAGVQKYIIIYYIARL